MAAPWEDHNKHGKFYRNVEGLDRPWLPSPVSSEVASGPSDMYPYPYDARWRPPTAPPLKVHYIGAHRRNLMTRWLLRLLRRDRMNLVHEIPMYHPYELDPPMPRYPPIPLSEWKAWGYYARPNINGMHVHNQTPRLQTTMHIDIEELYYALRGSKPGKDGQQLEHPERWVPGIHHPALPSRPQTWKRPELNAPLPFPWECYLNPWLSHNDGGVPCAVGWDLGVHPDTMWINPQDGPFATLSDPDKHQPATFPFVTHLVVNSLHLDGRPLPFQRIIIVNMDGICCIDVFMGVYEHFQKRVLREEYDTWDQSVRDEATSVNRYRAHHQKRRVTDILRCDRLGHNCMFDGLSVNPDRHGWILHVVREHHFPRRPTRI
ncbi:hypothetical protein BDZ89DRAFT_1069906 [Hymenopellis radicata]|nr:hypothetical protein BDZ89DRAFT_1069906 [Hymenopellis radicata]